jgi:cobalt-precorrin 5A hydrolase / cobalt-factor III methyltransferase / precorrin-3B C17-methyltransferase
VVAFYNPRSARRPDRLAEAAAVLLAHRAPATPTVIARNLVRAGETIRVVSLAGLAAEPIDMLSLVIVGSSRTRQISGTTVRVYTPRGYFPEPRR